MLEPAGAESLFPQAHAQGVGGIARECLANGLLVKPADQIDLKAYCSSPEQEQHRAQQLAELRSAAAADGRSVLRRALDYPRSVLGVGVSLVGARSIDQLRPLLSAAGTSS